MKTMLRVCLFALGGTACGTVMGIANEGWSLSFEPKSGAEIAYLAGYLGLFTAIGGVVGYVTRNDRVRKL